MPCLPSVQRFKAYYTSMNRYVHVTDDSMFDAVHQFETELAEKLA